MENLKEKILYEDKIKQDVCLMRGYVYDETGLMILFSVNLHGLILSREYIGARWLKKETYYKCRRLARIICTKYYTTLLTTGKVGFLSEVCLSEPKGQKNLKKNKKEILWKRSVINVKK